MRAVARVNRPEAGAYKEEPVPHDGGWRGNRSGGCGRSHAAAHAVKKRRKKFVDRQSQESLLVFVSGVAPAERHLVLNEGNETVVENRNAMSVGAEVTGVPEPGSTERRFAVDHTSAVPCKADGSNSGTAWAEPGREAGYRETGVTGSA